MITSLRGAERDLKSAGKELVKCGYAVVFSPCQGPNLPAELTVDSDVDRIKMTLNGRVNQDGSYGFPVTVSHLPSVEQGLTFYRVCR